MNPPAQLHILDPFSLRLQIEMGTTELRPVPSFKGAQEHTQTERSKLLEPRYSCQPVTRATTPKRKVFLSDILKSVFDNTPGSV